MGTLLVGCRRMRQCSLYGGGSVSICTSCLQVHGYTLSVVVECINVHYGDTYAGT